MIENNNLEEKKFSIAFNVNFNAMYEKDNFVKEVILPNLEKQAMIYFNGNGWFITQLDWESKKGFQWYTITCKGEK